MTSQPITLRPVSREALTGALAIHLLLLVTGCTERYTDYDAFLRDPSSTVSTVEYKLAPPDSIRIYSKRVTELNGYSEVIRSDGKITLPLVGTLYVNGKTSDEVAAEVEQLAKDFYEDADITIQVTGFNSKKVFVFGEVSIAGPFKYDGANTVLETLAAAQPTRLADPTQVQLVRPGSNGQHADRLTINLDRMIRQGDTTLNAVLEEGDIIFVPPNGMAAMGLAFQQLLLPIQPASATVRGPANIEETVVGTTYGREDR